MRVLLIVIVYLLSSCSISQYNDYVLKTGLKQLQLGVVFIDSDKKQIEGDYLPDEAYISFPLIPGGISGQVLTDSVYTLRLFTNNKFVLDLAAISKDVLPYAVPMFSTSYNHGVVIVPRETKLLRVGTFAYSVEANDFIGPTGIASLGDEKITQMMLVYFDRPARISGLSNEGDLSIEYDVVIRINWGRQIIRSQVMFG